MLEKIITDLLMKNLITLNKASLMGRSPKSFSSVYYVAKAFYIRFCFKIQFWNVPKFLNDLGCNMKFSKACNLETASRNKKRSVTTLTTYNIYIINIKTI